jgi:hypothetical protein
MRKKFSVNDEDLIPKLNKIKPEINMVKIGRILIVDKVISN